MNQYAKPNAVRLGRCPNSTTEWYESQEPGGLYYYSNDGEWVWDHVSSNGYGWVPIAERWKIPPYKYNQKATKYNDQQTAVTTTERTEDSMYIWNIAVTRNASVIEQQQGKSSQVIVPSQQVLAKDQNVAVAIFAAEHADVLKDQSADLLVVHVRQGV